MMHPDEGMDAHRSSCPLQNMPGAGPEGHSDNPGQVPWRRAAGGQEQRPKEDSSQWDSQRPFRLVSACASEHLTQDPPEQPH